MVKVKKTQMEVAATAITIFEGCSKEDVEHAKSFWKSLTLQPPLESRLVSADIKQRLRVAPIHTKTNKILKQEKDFHLLTENEMFLYQAREKEMQEKRNEYRRLANNRTQILNTLHQQRARRIEKEKISKNI